MNLNESYSVGRWPKSPTTRRARNNYGPSNLKASPGRTLAYGAIEAI
jgi:hypothetical protein